MDVGSGDEDGVWDPSFGEPGIDAVAWVQESSTMMAVLAAERFERVASARREALAGPVPFRGASPEIIERSLRLELAAALQMTETAVARMLHTAEALVNRYPAALDALHGGRTTERHVDVLVELVDTVEEELREAVVPVAVRLAETCALGTFRRRLRALVDTVRAASLEERHREALTRRRVILEPSEDGMAWLLVHLPAVEGHAVMNRLDATARVLADQDGEERTLDQLRADVAGDILVDGQVAAYPEHARGIAATVTVTVPALALLDDAYADPAAPPVVEGVGPIPLSRARELCGAAASWMRVLTHPRPGSCSPSAATPTVPRPICAASSGGVRNAAKPPDAACPRTAATSTIKRPGQTAAAPTSTTSPRCARTITS
ncbi:DUF222 domain-containing protein [Microbacterium sp. 10M-3C3]|uniref:DUF222 domain-containing protein n=1 Tax=Microbacterium sp. 10M-3C3 TaxID=2483401 RepID=UPI000F62D610|nr:DUF222 domain-containing protein [Microbacterium sp. 10M-3C3]